MLSKFSNALGRIMDAEPDDERVARGAQSAQKTEKREPERLYLGTSAHGYSVPYWMENRHFLFGGTTGTGKTRLFLQIGAHARRRGDKAFIVDHGGEQISRFYRPGDLIMNPFDVRFCGHSPYNELQFPWDADNIARYMIPDGIGSSAAWNAYAQTVAAALLRRCQEEGQTRMGSLIYHALASSAEDLQKFIGWNEPAVGMVDPKNDKMFASVRGILSNYFAPYRYVSDAGDFSLRKWVQDDTDRRWVFITYQDSMFGSLRSLISAWASMAIVYALDLPEDEHRRIWFLLDEIGTLDKMDALVDALTKIRKRGGCVVAGLQALSQFKLRYGDEGATTLLANFRTWITLASGDADTAELFSRHFGEQEIKRHVASDSASFGGGTNLSESQSEQYQDRRAIRYTDLMSLPDLEGRVKFPGRNPVGRIDAPIIDYPQQTPVFVPQTAPFVHDIRAPGARAPGETPPIPTPTFVGVED